MVAQPTDDELFDENDDFVQEDEDDSSEEDDELQKIINIQYAQFSIEQTVRREAIRASRPWSAPPLMSPRPETQRAKKAESAASREPEAVAMAENQPRQEYQPPEVRQGFNSSSLPASMAHLAARRPMSADHLRPNSSALGGQPLENIMEDMPLEDSASSVATSPRSAAGEQQPGLHTVDSCTRPEADDIESCNSSCPDDDLYDQVGKSISQLPSRRFTATSELEAVPSEQMMAPQADPVAASTEAGRTSDTSIECEADEAQEPEDTLETQLPADEPRAALITEVALRIPTTSAAAHAARSLAFEFEADSGQQLVEDAAESVEEGQDGLSDYGELLHPHEFALHLLHNDAGWVPPAGPPRSSPVQEQPDACLPDDAATTPTANQTGGSTQSRISKKTHSKGATRHAAVGEPDGAEAGGVTRRRAAEEELLEPQSFALHLLQHDAGTLGPVQHVAAAASVINSSARPRSAGPESAHGTHCTRHTTCVPHNAAKWAPARASTRAGLPAASARMVLDSHRAVGRPVSAPSQRGNTRTSPSGYTAFVSHGYDTALERRKGPYFNMGQLPPTGGPRGSARRPASHTLQTCHATGPLVSDDEAEVEILHHEDRSSGEGGKGQSSPYQAASQARAGDTTSATPGHRRPRASNGRPSTAPIGGRLAACVDPSDSVQPSWWYGSQYTDGSMSLPVGNSTATAKSRTSRRPASAHPLGRLATSQDGPQESYQGSGSGQTPWYPLGGTAVVGVCGTPVSVYMADTMRRVKEANRWLGVLGMHHRYRLVAGTSSVEVQMYDSRWLPPGQAALEAAETTSMDPRGHACASMKPDWAAVAPTIRKYNLGQFLSAHAKLSSTAAQLLGGPGDAGGSRAGRKTRPKSAAAAGPWRDISAKNDTHTAGVAASQRRARWAGRLSDEGRVRVVDGLMGALHTAAEVSAHIGKLIVGP